MSGRNPSSKAVLSERDRLCFRCVLKECDEDDPRCLWRELSETQRLILSTLYDVDLVCSQVAEEVDGKRGTILNNLYALKRCGYVIDDGARILVWSLTEEGKAYVDRERQARERSETRGV